MKRSIVQGSVFFSLFLNRLPKRYKIQPKISNKFVQHVREKSPFSVRDSLAGGFLIASCCREEEDRSARASAVWRRIASLISWWRSEIARQSPEHKWPDVNRERIYLDWQRALRPSITKRRSAIPRSRNGVIRARPAIFNPNDPQTANGRKHQLLSLNVTKQ